MVRVDGKTAAAAAAPKDDVAGGEEVDVRLRAEVRFSAVLDALKRAAEEAEKASAMCTRPARNAQG